MDLLKYSLIVEFHWLREISEDVAEKKCTVICNLTIICHTVSTEHTCEAIVSYGPKSFLKFVIVSFLSFA